MLVRTLFLAVLCSLAGPAAGGAPAGRADEAGGRTPNVVLILADDLGWSDTTLYGTTDFYRTPHLERLAARGMTFTRAYASSPLCSPTRASVLTGLSPARHGVTAPHGHLPAVLLKSAETAAGGPNRPSAEPTSATRLDTRFYTLAEALRDHGYATGHFGKWHLGPEPYSPLEHGFDVDLPHHPGPGPAGSYVAPWKFKDFDHDPGQPDQHIEDRMAGEAVAFMEEHADEPFFLNYWMFSVHAPFDAKKELIEKYRKTVDQQARQQSPTYAAMVESMDDAVGTLLDALDRLGIAENTVVVLASDNGGNMYNYLEGGPPTSNAPLRGGKATVWEGGVRGPAVVVHPGVTEPGSVSDEIIQSSDFYPTLLAALDIDPRPGQTFDGADLTPVLAGGTLGERAIFTYFPHSPGVPDWLPASISVHRGDWKLIRVFHGGENGAHRYQLFDLSTDVGERTNLAGENPELVAELDALIERHLEETGAARPRPNPNFDAAGYDLAAEGAGKLKGGPDDKPKRPKGGPPVAGWRAGGTAALAKVPGALRITSTGGDPHLSAELPTPAPAGCCTVRVTMASDSAGTGRVMWRGAAKPYGPDRGADFAVTHDGTERTYEVSFDAATAVTHLRLDPSTGKGRVDVSEVVLLGDDGVTLARWSF